MNLKDLKTRDDIGFILNDMNLKIGVEVGVAFGENAEMILKKSNLSMQVNILFLMMKLL